MNFDIEKKYLQQ